MELRPYAARQVQAPNYSLQPLAAHKTASAGTSFHVISRFQDFKLAERTPKFPNPPIPVHLGLSGYG